MEREFFALKCGQDYVNYVAQGYWLGTKDPLVATRYETCDFAKYDCMTDMRVVKITVLISEQEC